MGDCSERPTDLLNDPALVVARRQVIEIDHLLDVVPHLLNKLDVNIRLRVPKEQ